MPKNCIVKCSDTTTRIVALITADDNVRRITNSSDRRRKYYFTSTDARRTVAVTAVTDPTNATEEITWDIPPQLSHSNSGRNVYLQRSPVGGPYDITAYLNETRYVSFYFVDIQSLVCENGTRVDDTDTWKFYVSDGFAEILATPNPNEEWFREQLDWNISDNRCTKHVGIAGQGNSNPTFVFGDHALVLYKGAFYDPSYGTGPFSTLKDWEDSSIAGLADYDCLSDADFCQGGLPLSMPMRCSPGFIKHKITVGQTLDDVATMYGIGSAISVIYDPVKSNLHSSPPRRRGSRWL